MSKSARFEMAMWASVTLATAALIAPAGLGSPALAQTAASPEPVSFINLWQSGIKTIDLVGDGPRSFGFHDYPQPPLNCARTPPRQRLDGFYTVPPSAAPGAVIRLRAIVEDFAGNKTKQEAVFIVEQRKDADEPDAGNGRQDAGGRQRGNLLAARLGEAASCRPVAAAVDLRAELSMEK